MLIVKIISGDASETILEADSVHYDAKQHHFIITISDMEEIVPLMSGDRAYVVNRFGATVSQYLRMH